MTSISPLGCQPPTRLNECCSLQKYSFISEQTPPPSLMREGGKFIIEMWDNNILANCTSCGIADGLSYFVSLGYFTLPITTADVNAFYSLSTGYSPNIPGSDLGGEPTHVLEILQDKGYKLQYPGKKDYSYTFPAVFGVIDYSSRKSIANGIYSLGFVYGAFALTLMDQKRVYEDEVWDDDMLLELENGKNDLPWSWGGHVMIIIGYTGLGDCDFVTLVTWGRKYKATWRWVEKRLVALYGVSFPELFNTHGFNPAGLNTQEVNEFLHIGK